MVDMSVRLEVSITKWHAVGIDRDQYGPTFGPFDEPRRLRHSWAPGPHLFRGVVARADLTNGGMEDGGESGCVVWTEMANNHERVALGRL